MAQQSGDQRRSRPTEAYRSEAFLNSRAARSLRILSEYIEPQSRFEHFQIEDTIVFMGSARLLSREQAEQALQAAQQRGGDVSQAEKCLEMSAYYEAARELAYQLTTWSKQLPAEAQRFVVCTGGGPGIMEAANRGASEAQGLNVGLTISIPIEEFDNRYVTRELSFHFHYFFMRKFWFAYLAKAVVVFPGGFGTLDELFELLTLRQTQKMRKHLPIVLYGSAYWQEIINFDALIRHGMINPDDVQIFHVTDSVDDAFTYLTDYLRTYALAERGAIL
jgi:uncharacterized protein (TIGR00730 family)